MPPERKPLAPRRRPSTVVCWRLGIEAGFKGHGSDQTPGISRPKQRPSHRFLLARCPRPSRQHAPFSCACSDVAVILLVRSAKELPMSPSEERPKPLYAADPVPRWREP